MKRAYQVVVYALAVEVVLQAAFIAYGIAGVGKWVDDGHVLTKKVLDASSPDFRGAGGFELHGMNGTVVIPVLAVLMVVVAYLAKPEGGTRRAWVLFGMVVLQIALGLGAGNQPWLAPLHVLNGFGLFAMAAMTARGTQVARVAEPVAA